MKKKNVRKKDGKISDPSLANWKAKKSGEYKEQKEPEPTWYCIWAPPEFGPLPLPDDPGYQS